MRQRRDQLLRGWPADRIIDQGRRDRHGNRRRVRTGRLRHRRQQQAREITDIHRGRRGRTRQTRNTDAGEYRSAVGLQQDIVRIELSVDDAGGMRRGQCLGHRQPDRDDLTGVEAIPRLQQVAQADRPDNRLGDNREALGGGNHVDDREEVGMGKPEQDLRRSHRGIPGRRVRWQSDTADHALGPRGHHAAGPDLPGTAASNSGPQHHPVDGRSTRNPMVAARTHGIVHCCHKQ